MPPRHGRPRACDHDGRGRASLPDQLPWQDHKTGESDGQEGLATVARGAFKRGAKAGLIGEIGGAA